MLLLNLLLATSTYADRTMLIQAAFNPTQIEQGVSVAITGHVFDPSNASLANAAISIQVNNPQGTSIHVAVAYSDPTGAFSDSFLITSNSPGGNYTAYLVADKPGYVTARLTLTLIISTPDFSIQTSIGNMSIEQGRSASLTLTVLSIRQFNQPINLTALEHPTGVTLEFTPGSIVPSATSVVTVSASNFASVGNYTITLLGVSGSLTHKTSFHLTITPGLLQPINITTILIGWVGLVILISAIGMRRRRARKAVAIDQLICSAETDTGYVATARVIARLEELRGMGKVDESTYQRLKREYEKRLERSK
jgi:uncharacterized membrane protein